MLTQMQLPLTHSRSRRKGQALILAILVMLFAVLLSSAFLVVIGSAGRQVGRETDRSEASRNADKGVAFVLARIRAYSDSDHWNPASDPVLTKAGLPPQPSDADYTLYYSSLDKTMGWSRGATTLPDDSYVKYPDPRTSRQAPEFLVSSQLVTDDDSGGDKRFMRRITVIGLSSKNPDLWSRRILYKTTNWNGGTFSYANFVTAFDPDSKKSIVAPLSANVTIPAASVGSLVQISIASTKGQGNERANYSPLIGVPGNTLMLSDGINTPVVGIVAPATVAGMTNLRVLKTGTTDETFAANSKVALVGSLFESPSNIDTDGNGNGVPDMPTNEGPTQTQPIVSVSTASVPYAAPFGNGALFNNGLNVPLTTPYAARPAVAPAVGSSTVAGQNVLASPGPVSIGDPSPTTVPPTINIVNAVAAGTPTPIPFTQPAANVNQFLRVGFDASGNAQSDTASSATAPVVVPRTVNPALINFAAYRAKAQTDHKVPTVQTDETVLTCLGLYINNPQDVEKFNGTPLTSSQLQRLWQRKSFITSTDGNVTYSGTNAAITASNSTAPYAARLCYARPGVDSYVYPLASGGLEARGIRGWISPWEFLPRGPQIILNGTTITIIRDPLSDASSNAPDTDKAVIGRQFTQTLTQPTVTTGATPQPITICLEGNARVQGTWTGDSPISIVSNNNIYIEGSIKAAAGKVALLAKKNVVLNPTQFVSHFQGTVDTSVGKDAVAGTVDGTNSAIIHLDTTKFKLGDQVAVFAEQGAPSVGWHTVQDITTTTITLDSALPATTYTGNVKVKLACDPPIVLAKRDLGDDVPNNEHFQLTTGDPATKDATISEVPINVTNVVDATNTTNLTQAGLFWAYAFKTGGDTLTRYIPFKNATGTQYNIGVAARQAAAKKNVLFTVQGGTDPDPLGPQDDGVRKFSIRQNDTVKPYELSLAPKPGDINNQDTFDLRDINATGSPQGDVVAQNLGALNTLFTNRAGDAEVNKTRWRLPGITDPNIAALEGRRFARVQIPDFTLPVPVEDESTPLTTIRAPLTSSVILFGGPLPQGAAPVASNTLLRIGSLYDYQTTAGDPTLETSFIEASSYGQAPIWDQQASSGVPDVVKYNQVEQTDTISWTRDGAGDYNDQLPAYYLSGWRFQRVEANQSVPATSGDPKVNMAVEVDATIDAEGGSWFVIPVPTPTANGAAPADPAQQVEWRRPGYAITINGNITQMMTPSSTVDYDDEPDPDSVITGAMKRWTDSLAYQNDAGGTSGIGWRTINYNAAPLPVYVTNAMGVIQVDPVTKQPIPAPIPPLPSSSDILYTYSN